MTFQQLQARAHSHNCSVRWGEIRNGNSPFFGKAAHSTRRSTHFAGFEDQPSSVVTGAVIAWIRGNS
jgi:hypothetical protein